MNAIDDAAPLATAWSALAPEWSSGKGAAARSVAAMRRLVVTQIALENEVERLYHALEDSRRTVGAQAALLARQDGLMRQARRRTCRAFEGAQAMLRRQAGQTGDSPWAEELLKCADRLAIHTMIEHALTDLREDAAIEMEPFLQRLLEAKAQALPGRVIALDARGVQAEAAHAGALALIVMELVSNALIFGAGRVMVTMLHEDDGIALSVEDEGHSLPEAFDPERGGGGGLGTVMALLHAPGDLAVDRTRGHTCFVARLRI